MEVKNLETLLELVKRLKKTIYNATNQNYYKGEPYSEEDIHKIRVAVRKIDNEKIDKSKFDFLDKCFEFKSIYEYFYFSERQEFDQHYNPLEEVNSVFDPLCIYLMDINYEVNIKKISIVEDIESFHSHLYEYINSMEFAFSEKDYKRVMSLSSTILQSVFKEICDRLEITYKKSDNFPTLFKKVKEKIKLDPELYQETPELRDFCSKISNLIILINELRNLYSESHGQSQKTAFDFANLPSHHFKLIVDTTKLITNFLVSTYNFQYEALQM